MHVTRWTVRGPPTLICYVASFLWSRVAVSYCLRVWWYLRLLLLLLVVFGFDHRNEECLSVMKVWIDVVKCWRTLEKLLKSTIVKVLQSTEEGGDHNHKGTSVSGGGRHILWPRKFCSSILKFNFNLIYFLIPDFRLQICLVSILCKWIVHTSISCLFLFIVRILQHREWEVTSAWEQVSPEEERKSTLPAACSAARAAAWFVTANPVNTWGSR